MKKPLTEMPKVQPGEWVQAEVKGTPVWFYTQPRVQPRNQFSQPASQPEAGPGSIPSLLTGWVVSAPLKKTILCLKKKKKRISCKPTNKEIQRSGLIAHDCLLSKKFQIHASVSTINVTFEYLILKRNTTFTGNAEI